MAETPATYGRSKWRVAYVHCRQIRMNMLSLCTVSRYLQHRLQLKHGSCWIYGATQNIAMWKKQNKNESPLDSGWCNFLSVAQQIRTLAAESGLSSAGGGVQMLQRDMFVSSNLLKYRESLCF